MQAEDRGITYHTRDLEDIAVELRLRGHNDLEEANQPSKEHENGQVNPSSLETERSHRHTRQAEDEDPEPWMELILPLDDQVEFVAGVFGADAFVNDLLIDVMNLLKLPEVDILRTTHEFALI